MKTIEQLAQEAREAKAALSRALDEHDVCGWKVADIISEHIVAAAVASIKHELAVAEKNKPDPLFKRLKMGDTKNCANCMHYEKESFLPFECVNPALRKMVDADAGFSFEPPKDFLCSLFEAKAKSDMTK